MVSRREGRLARKFQYLLNFLNTNDVSYTIDKYCDYYDGNTDVVYIPARPRADKELKTFVENYLERFGYNWYYNHGKFMVIMSF